MCSPCQHLHSGPLVQAKVPDTHPHQSLPVSAWATAGRLTAAVRPPPAQLVDTAWRASPCTPLLWRTHHGPSGLSHAARHTSTHHSLVSQAAQPVRCWAPTAASPLAEAACSLLTSNPSSKLCSLSLSIAALGARCFVTLQSFLPSASRGLSSRCVHAPVVLPGCCPRLRCCLPRGAGSPVLFGSSLSSALQRSDGSMLR